MGYKYRRLNPAGAEPREVARVVNEIINSLERMANSFGVFSADFDAAQSTISGRWDPVDVTFGSPSIGWEIQNVTEIHALKNQGQGIATINIIASNTTNNRNFHVGLRLNGNDSAIDYVSFNSRDVGIFIFTGSINTDTMNEGDYVEVVTSSDTSETWDLSGSLSFTVTTAAVDTALVL